MPVALSEIRAQLLPGLMAIARSQPAQWDELFAAPFTEPLPEIVFGPGAIVAMGAAAAVIKNPAISRRNLFGSRN